jgi:hypothetical protein
MSSQVNPYAPPTAEVADISSATSEAEAIRQEHIKHEASIRSISTLYFIGGFFLALAALTMIALPLFTERASFGVALGVIYVVLAALSIAMARGIRRFEPWARTTAIVFACIGLLGFPLGTLLNGYILYLLLSEKGKRIFAPDYAEIVAATPHIKYKTSMIVWVLLALLLLGVGAALFNVIINR